MTTYTRAEAVRRGVTVTTILNEAIQAAKDQSAPPGHQAGGAPLSRVG